MKNHKIKIKHLIGLENTDASDINKIIEVGFLFREILDRPIKKVPILRKIIRYLFYTHNFLVKIKHYFNLKKYFK